MINKRMYKLLPFVGTLVLSAHFLPGSQYINVTLNIIVTCVVLTWIVSMLIDRGKPIVTKVFSWEDEGKHWFDVSEGWDSSNTHDVLNVKQDGSLIIRRIDPSSELVRCAIEVNKVSIDIVSFEKPDVGSGGYVVT